MMVQLHKAKGTAVYKILVDLLVYASRIGLISRAAQGLAYCCSR